MKRFGPFLRDKRVLPSVQLLLSLHKYKADKYKRQNLYTQIVINRVLHIYMDWITSLLFLIISLWYLLFRCVMLIFDFLFRHVILISAFCCFIMALCYWSWRRNQQMDLRNASQNNDLRGIESSPETSPHLAYHACPESTALELPRHDADLHDTRVTPSLPTFTHDKSHSP